MSSRFLLTGLTLIAAAVIAISCGSGSEGSGDQSSGAESSGEPLIIQVDQVFTPDSFTQLGWKKSKQYDTETVPESTEIWYGFFNQKDIEIRFYETHAAAIEFGIPSAEAAIEGAVGRSQGGRLLDFSGGSFSAYADYLVAGNAVLMCELERSTCEGLAAELP